MRNPSQAWALQIEITNACPLNCSNCTRLLGHRQKSFFMSPDELSQVLDAVVDFTTDSDKDPGGRGKLIGLMGGEPLVHPQFPDLVDIMVERIPNVQQRGLWTSLDFNEGEHPKWGPYRPHVERLVGPHEGDGRGLDGRQGWLNYNPHHPSMRVEHQPVLVASKDAIPDDAERWKVISECWLQKNWSPSATAKGFYFCEVAQAIDTVIGGVTPIPLEPGCWKGDIDFVEDERGVLQPKGKFADQIKSSCERCGVCVRLKGRGDSEEVDDVSQSNMDDLVRIGSPRLKAGRVAEWDGAVLPDSSPWAPRWYRKGRGMTPAQVRADQQKREQKGG